METCKTNQTNELIDAIETQKFTKEYWRKCATELANTGQTYCCPHCIAEVGRSLVCPVCGQDWVELTYNEIIEAYNNKQLGKTRTTARKEKKG